MRYIFSCFIQAGDDGDSKSNNSVQVEAALELPASGCLSNLSRGLEARRQAMWRFLEMQNGRQIVFAPSNRIYSLLCLTGLAELRDNYSILYPYIIYSNYRIIASWFQFDFTCLCSVLVLSCNHVLHVDCFWKMPEPQFVSLVPSGIE